MTAPTVPQETATEMPEALSVSDAGSLLSGLLTDEASPPERPRGADGKFLPTKAKTEPKVEAVADEDGTEVPATGEEETPAEGEEEVEVETPPPTRTLKVKVDGLETEVPEDEVVKGYSRTADYTRKTQALAAERQRFEAEELTPLREERRYYAERITLVEDLIQSLQPDAEPDWNSLRNQMTPEEFTTQFATWRGQQQRMEKIRAERSRVETLHAEDEQRRFRAQMAREQEKLKDLIPEFGDAEKGATLKRDLSDFAHSLGFTDEDVAGITDARVVKVLHDARLYAEGLRKKPKVEDKVDRVLDTIKPSAAKPAAKTTEFQKAQTRLKTSGSLADAAAALNHLL